MWERIDANTTRMNVPGGWIVRSYVFGMGCSVHQIFIADALHLWVIE